MTVEHETLEAHEGRLSALEQNVTHALQMIERTNQSMERGFAEQRTQSQEMMRQLSQQISDANQKISDAYQRAGESKQVSWPLVSILLVLVGGAVTFVRMSLSPVEKDVTETREMLDHHVELGGHQVALTRMATLDEKVQDAHFEIEKLHTFSDNNLRLHTADAVHNARSLAILEQVVKQQDRRWPEFISNAENRGRMAVLLSSLREAYDNLESRVSAGTGDRFFGREGEELKSRILAIESFLREKTTSASVREQTP